MNEMRTSRFPPPRGWLTQLFHSAFTVTATGAGLVCYAECSGQETFAAFASGLICTSVIWLSALKGFAWPIVFSDNVLLAPLTPLTFRHYLRNNIQRNALLILTTIVIIPPLLLSAVCVANPSSPGMAAFQSWQFLLNTALFYYTALAVSLAETISGMRGITSLVFMLRHLLRQAWPLFLLFFMTLQFTYRWVSPVIMPPLRRLIDTLANMGGAGHWIFFLVSPISGISMAANTPGNEAFSWSLTFFLSGMLGISVYRIRKTLDISTSSADEDFFNHWCEHRVKIELDEEVSNGKEASEDDPCCATSLSLDIGSDTAENTVVCVPYNARLTPEEQVLRHKEYERRRKRLDMPFLRHIPPFAIAHLWSIVTALSWAIWLSGLLDKQQLTIFPFVIPGMIFACCVNNAAELRPYMANGAGLPLRWFKLIRNDYLRVLLRNGAADLLAGLLLTRITGYAPQHAFAFFAILQAMRLSSYGTLWLWSLRRASLARWRWLYAFLYFVLLMALFFMIVFTGIDFIDKGSQTAVFPLPLYALLCALALLILPGVFLAAALRKRGSDVLGRYTPLKPFSHEPL